MPPSPTRVWSTAGWRAWFKGVYWWKWFTDLPGEGDPFVPADLPAEAVLKGWYTSRG